MKNDNTKNAPTENPFKAPTAEDTTRELLAGAENQLPPISSPAVATAKALDPKTVTVDDVEKLAATDPGAAATLLTLLKDLKAMRAEENERKAGLKMALGLAREAQVESAKVAASQASCERARHVRQNGECALGGQWDSNHRLITICVVCQKMYLGVGDGPGELPQHLYDSMSADAIGG